MVVRPKLITPISRLILRTQQSLLRILTTFNCRGFSKSHEFNPGISSLLLSSIVMAWGLCLRLPESPGGFRSRMTKPGLATNGI